MFFVGCFFCVFCSAKRNIERTQKHLKMFVFKNICIKFLHKMYQNKCLFKYLNI